MDEFSQVCEFNQFHNVHSETAKMRFFPFTLKERAKEWFFTLGREFASWRDMEDAFLRKYYSVGKTSAVRHARYLRKYYYSTDICLMPLVEAHL